MTSRRRGSRTSVRRAFFSLAATALACAAPAWSATTPLDALYISPDSAITIQNLTVLPGEAVRTSPLALADLGVLPKEANLIGYHRTADGRQLFTLDVSATLAGGVTVTPADVVAYDGNDYTIEFDGLARGLPRGVEIDAIAMIDGDLLLSFDSAVSFSGFTADDEDLVRVAGGSISLFFDGSAAGVAPGLDLDGAERLSNGHLLLSFDGSGSLGGVSFDDEDVLEHDPAAGTWEIVFDGSLTGTGWGGADVDAVAAEEVVTATPTILATETLPPTQTPNPSATFTAQPPTQTPTETRVPTQTLLPSDTPTEVPTRTSVPTLTASATAPVPTVTGTVPPSATSTATPIVSATPTPTATSPPEPTATATVPTGFLAGDANCDGRVNVADVTEVVDLVAHGASQCGSDANCDGVTDAADVDATVALIFVAPAVCP